MEPWLIFIGIIVVIWTVGKVCGYLQQRQKVKLEEIKDIKREKRDLEEARIRVKRDREALDIIAKEKSQGFPWLAEAYSDYFYLQDLKDADYLKYKSHPAPKAADHIKEIASKRRIAEKLYRILKYQLEYYENLFPWLIEFKGEDLDDLIRKITEKKEKGGETEEVDDPVKIWLTEAEYNSLSRTERNQRALDRYWQKKKSKWEIGRDYERYIGYLYEKAGCSVYYQGAIEGLEDLGRDLIAKKGDTIEIVQCKCWSQEKTIHEKHIFQLFGTTVEYWLKNAQKQKISQLQLFPDLLQKGKIKPTFITSTRLSEKAKEFANVLGVQVIENLPLKHYPSVKCNVSRRTGEKIYHLPFDQQYDRTLIEEERNECYVETVKEAEDLGFRRAFRWRGKRLE